MARTIRREEVAFPSAPDPRFGGNLARANVGKQYSRAFPGGPPGVDRRYENYQAPHRVDYTSPQGGTYPHELQHPDPRGKRQRERHLQHLYGDPPYGQSDTFTNPFYPPKQHPNPRMRGMGGGLGSLQEKSQLRRPESFTNMDMFNRPDLSFRYSHMDPEKGDESIRGTWRRMEDARRADEMDEYGYLEGAPRQRTTFTEGYMLPHHFNEMYGGVYDDAILRSQGIMGALPGEYETSGLWQTWKKILERTGNEDLANQWLESQYAV